MINVNEIVWLDPNQSQDEMPMIEYFYRLMGEILRVIYERNKSWQEVTSFFFENKLNERFKELEPNILEDNLFESLATDIPEVGGTISLILKDNKEELTRMGVFNN